MSENVKIKMNNSALKELEERGELFIATIAENVRLEAKTLAPVDTGALRDSIEVFDGDSKKEKYIGSITIPYAIYQELGTVKMSPQPYLRPALDNIVASLEDI